MTDERIKELASKWASKYTHRSAPLESVFSFMDRNLIEFSRAIEADARKEQAEKMAELELKLQVAQQVIKDLIKYAACSNQSSFRPHFDSVIESAKETIKPKE